MRELTQREAELAMERIRKWPREARVALTRLSEPEAQTIALLVALLDIRPHEEEEKTEEETTAASL